MISFNNVLYVIFDRYPYFKGSSTHVTYFTEALKSGGYNVKIAALGGINSGNIISINTDKKGNIFKRSFQFSDRVFDILAKENRFNIVHFRDPFVGFQILEFKNKLGVSTVYEVNSFPSIEWRERYGKIDENGIKVIEEMENVCISESDVIITTSSVTKRYIENRFKRVERVFVIPNGVDVDFFYPRKVVEENSVLFCGAVRPWQGIFEFVEVAGKFMSQKSLFLKVVGDIKKDDRKKLSKLCKKSGLRCEIVGIIPYEFVPEMINRSKICVLPLNKSKRNVVQGACPIKLFEYMACKKPVLSSDLEIVREHFDSYELFYFNPFNLEEIKDGINRILSQDREKSERIEMGYNKVLKKYQWKFSGDKLLEVYKKFFPV